LKLKINYKNKKYPESTQVNLPNPDHEIEIISKKEKNEVRFSINSTLKNKIEKKNQLKKDKKNRANIFSRQNLQLGSWDCITL